MSFFIFFGFPSVWCLFPWRFSIELLVHSILHRISACLFSVRCDSSNHFSYSGTILHSQSYVAWICSQFSERHATFEWLRPKLRKSAAKVHLFVVFDYPHTLDLCWHSPSHHPYQCIALFNFTIFQLHNSILSQVMSHSWKWARKINFSLTETILNS